MPVTIVIPVYNRKGLIQKTLDSIPAEYPLILVDNNSTDGSYEFCKQYAQNNHKRKITLAKELTPGAASARNKGLSLCKTEWIYFFDSDDIFTSIPEPLPGYDLICFPVAQETDGKLCARDYSPVSTPHTHILNSMLDTQSMLFRTDWLRAIGSWNPKCLVWDDWELGLRALLNNPRLLWVTDKVRHRIIIHPDSITGPTFSSRFPDILQTLNIVFEEIYEEPKGRTINLFALYLRAYILCGKLLKEGNLPSVSDLHAFLALRFQTDKQSQRIGKILQWYTSKGGRGAWKIALKLIDTLYHIK